MTHAADPALLVSLVTSAAYVVLGAWVLTLTPRRRPTFLLAGFAMVYGLSVVVPGVLTATHVIEGGGLGDAALNDLFPPVISLFVFGLAVSIPDALDDRRLTWIALATGLAFIVATTAIAFAEGPPSGIVPLWIDVPSVVASSSLLYAGMLVLPLRARRVGAPDEATQLAVLALAFTLLGGFVGPVIPSMARELAAGQPVTVVALATILLPWLVAAALWLRNMAEAGPRTLPVHRAAGIGILGIVAVGAVYEVAVPGAEPAGHLAASIRRTLAVGLIAYGVLRHDLAGLDEKVEFGVSKTTVAGIFVAVFFVVSEGAQVLFAGFAGSEFLGVLAAGALVFFLAPIQRAADRFASRAVPGGAVPTAGSDEESYRRAVEATLADGEVTSDEEQHLAELVDQLDISSARAYEIRREVEDEAGGGDEP